MDQIGVNILTALPVALLASWFTTWITLRKSKAETVWQRKLEAFEKILRALHVCRVDARESYKRELRENNFEWNNRKKYEPTEEEKKARQRMKEDYEAADAALEEVIDTGLLLLPPEVTRILNETRKPRNEDWMHMDVLEFYETHENIHKEAIDEITLIARQELFGKKSALSESGQ